MTERVSKCESHGRLLYDGSKCTEQLFSKQQFFSDRAGTACASDKLLVSY